MLESSKPVVKVVAIGIVELNDGKLELRLLREAGNWVPNLFVDNVHEMVTEPPECFTPTQEVIDKLDAAFYELFES